MSVGKIVSFFAFVIAINGFLSVTAEKFECPSPCRCSSSFFGVTCPGMTEFPDFAFAARVKSLDLSDGYIKKIRKESLKAYENLQYLDLRGNELKDVERGLFSEMGPIRRLYIDKNPWSCNTSSLEVLQNELIDLIEKNQHLDNFDGGKIKCFGPPEMKGKKPLYYRNTTAAQTRFLIHSSKANSGSSSPAVVIILMVIMVLLFIAVVLSIMKMYGEKLVDMITEFRERGSTDDEMDKMEAGKLETKTLLTESMKKRRRKSRAIPEANTSTSSSDEDENAKQTRHTERPKPKKKKPQPQSGGFTSEDGSSGEYQTGLPTVVNPTKEWKQKSGGFYEDSFDTDESGHSTVVDLEDYLNDKLKEQRRQSCGFTKGETSIAANESTLSTLFSLENYLKEKMKEERGQLCDLEEANSSIEEDWKFTTVELYLD